MSQGRVVIACYKPFPGKEDQLKSLMKTHLPILRKEGLVTDRASIIMAAMDGTIIEVFEWKSGKAIEIAHQNSEVQKMWGDFAQVCEYIPANQISEIQNLFSEFTPLN